MIFPFSHIIECMEYDEYWIKCGYLVNWIKALAVNTMYIVSLFVVNEKQKQQQ